MIVKPVRGNNTIANKSGNSRYGKGVSVVLPITFKEILSYNRRQVVYNRENFYYLNGISTTMAGSPEFRCKVETLLI